MNAEQQREWETDTAQPCTFPEPLAEVLTRENRELRAEVERLRDRRTYWIDEARHQEDEVERLRERLADPWDLDGNAAATAWKARAEDEAALAERAEERLRRVRELAQRWESSETWEGKPAMVDRGYGARPMIALDAEPW